MQKLCKAVATNVLPFRNEFLSCVEPRSCAAVSATCLRSYANGPMSRIQQA